METLVGILFRIPTQLIVCVALAAILKPHHRARYYALALLLLVSEPFIEPIAPSVLKYFLALFVGTIPALVYSKDKLTRKVFICLLFSLALVLSELLASTYWLGSGFRITPIEGLLYPQTVAYALLAFIISWGSLLVMGYCVYAIDLRVSKTRTDEGVRIFAWFITAQLLTILLSMGLGAGDRASMLLYIDGFTAIVVLFIVADLVCFYYMEKYNQEILRRRHASYLERQVEENLEHYALLEQQVKALGRARHDARNQASVITMLVAEGNRDGAKQHIDALIQEADTSLELNRSMAEPLLAEAQQAEEPLSAEARQVEATLSAKEAPFSHSEALGTDEAASESNNSSKRSAALSEQDIFDTDERFGRFFRVAKFALPFSQVIALLYLLTSFLFIQAPWGAYAAMAATTVLCVIADVFALRAIEETEGKWETLEAIRLLEEQSDSQRAYIRSVDERLCINERMKDEFLRSLYVVREKIDYASSDDIARDLSLAVDVIGGGGELYCENKVINVLLSTKMSQCRREGLKPSCAVTVPEEFFVSSIDLCALFSNMIDNAINACRKVEEENRSLEVKACVMSGMFILEVVNSCLPADVKRLANKKSFKLDDMFEDGHLREHGWGMHIVETLAKRYDGLFEIAPEGKGRCRATIMLPVSREASRATSKSRLSRIG